MAAMAPEEQLKVAATGLPSARVGAQASPDIFGAGLARTGQEIGLALYSREVREANQTALMAADRLLADSTMQLQIKLQDMRGKDAMAAPEVLTDEFAKAADEIEKELANDQQREAFKRVRLQRWGELSPAIQKHVAQEKTVYQDGETSAYLKTSVDRARLNAADPSIVDMELTRQEAVLREWAQRKGLGRWVEKPGVLRVANKPLEPQDIPETTELQGIPNKQFKTHADYGPTGTVEQIRDREDTLATMKPPMERVWEGSPAYDEKLAEVRSKTNTEVIKGLLYNGKDLSAQRYYDGHKSEFTAADRDGIEKVLEEGSYRGEAQRLVREWLSSGDHAGAIEVANKLDDPKLVQFTKQLIHQDMEERDALHRRGLEQTYLSAVNAIDDPNHKGMAPRQVIPPDVWMTLPLGERNALEQRAKERDKPGDRPNDDRLWLQFLDLPAEQVAALPLNTFQTKYWLHFDNHTRTRAEAQWNASKNAVEKKDAKEPALTQGATFHQQLLETFRNSGLVKPSVEVGKYSDDEVKMLGRFEREATAALEQAELAAKRKLTPTERQKVLDDVKDHAIKKVWVPGVFFNSQKPLIGLEEDEKGRAVVPLERIPPAHQEMMKNYMRSIGKQPTVDKLRRGYGQFMQGNRAAFEAIAGE